MAWGDKITQVAQRRGQWKPELSAGLDEPYHTFNPVDWRQDITFPYYV